MHFTSNNTLINCTKYCGSLLNVMLPVFVVKSGAVMFRVKLAGAKAAFPFVSLQ